MNEFDFDSIPEFKLEGIKIKGKTYELREPTGDVVTKYKNVTMGSTRFENGKLVKIDGLADAEPLLVSLCIFEVTGENKYKAVSINEVRSWRAIVQKKLFNELKKHIDLVGDDEDSPEKIKDKIKELQSKLENLQQGDSLGKDSTTNTQIGIE